MKPSERRRHFVFVEDRILRGETCYSFLEFFVVAHLLSLQASRCCGPSASSSGRPVPSASSGRQDLRSDSTR